MNLNAIKNKAAGKVTTSPQQNNMYIELVVNANRIDLSWDRPPFDSTLRLLKDNGWRWDEDRRKCRHEDTQAIREWLRKTFQADIEDKNPPPAIPPVQPPTPPVTAETPEDEPIDEVFAVYRRQIDELIIELKISPADLQLRAIDALHKQVFPRN